MSTPTESVRRHYRAAVQEYEQHYRPGYAEYPASAVRLDILLRRLKDTGVRTILDCGCGEATPILRMHRDLGADVWGFDFVPEMVDLGRQHLEQVGLHARVWQGDITDPASFRKGVGAPPSFDATLAMGVFPHVSDELTGLRNMASATRPGGRVMVSFRNELMALASLNRYSDEFVRSNLLRLDALKRTHPSKAGLLDEVGKQIAGHYRLDLPPQRKGSSDVPGFDEILAKFHNPLEMPRLFAQAGLRVDRIHFYHQHALPPMFEPRDPAFFREASLALERDPEDWRGHFLASAFVVESVKGSP